MCAALGYRDATMNKSDFFYGPPRDLTPEELDALRHVQACVGISEGLYYRLELRDLIIEAPRGWQLTKTGEFRLAAGK